MEIELSRELKVRFASFIEVHPPRQFGSMLRCILLDYMGRKVEIGFPLGFGQHLLALNDLFDLLERAAIEIESEEIKERGVG